MAHGHFILSDDGKTPIRCSFNEQLAYEREHKGRDWRRVALTVVGEAKVSTIFLAIDHRFGRGAPLLWETMVFGGEHDGYQDRYSTYDEAMVGHAKAVELAGGNQGAMEPAKATSASAAQK